MDIRDGRYRGWGEVVWTNVTAAQDFPKSVHQTEVAGEINSCFFFLFCFYQRRVLGNCYLQVKQIHPSELVTTFNMLTFIINLQECNKICCFPMLFFFLFFISWRLITLQYCSGFCHTLTWISHGYTCIPHPNPPSHLPLHLIPLGLPSAPGLSTCLMHPTWAGDLFHPRQHTNAILRPDPH